MPIISGKEVGPIGYGMMGLTWRREPPPIEHSIACLKAALDAGCNLWNGGEFYGTPTLNSPVLLSHYFERYPEDAAKIVLNIKGAAGPDVHSISGAAEELDRSIGAVLGQLKGRKKLDQFECARRDAKTPLAETFGHLQKEYVDKGIVGGIALSEVRAETIHEAVKYIKVVAVEVELSMWTRDPLQNGVAAACAQYGIPLIAYSPMGRGMLAGRWKSADEIPPDWFLKMTPRATPENFALNIQLVKQIEEIAVKKGCTKAQLAINWTRCLGKRPGMPVIIPIPGSADVERIKENAKVIDLTDEEMAEIDAILDKFEVVGERYPTAAPINT